MDYIFYYIGNFGPILIICITLYLLLDKKTHLFYYIFGVIINFFLNLVLKGIIQSPRPTFDDTNNTNYTQYIKLFAFQNGIPFNLFGMPSEHAQLSFFSLYFIYLSLQNSYVTFLYLILSVIICYQRIYYKFNYLSQVIASAIIGILMGHLVYNITKKCVIGKNTLKPDDYAFCLL